MICLKPETIHAHVSTSADSAVVPVNVFSHDPFTPTESCSYLLVAAGDIEPSPFAMNTEQAAEIGGAMLLIFAIAWAFRAIVRALNTTDER